MEGIFLEGYKYRLKPTKEQEVYLSKCFGCARKVYNIYVDLLYIQLEGQNYENGYIKGVKFPTPATFKAEYAFLKEVDSLALANVQLDFKDAVAKFNRDSDKRTYRKSARKKEQTIGRKLTFRDLKGMPSFKSKKDSYQSFTTNNQNGTVSIIDGNYIKIPKLKTPIKFINHREVPEGYSIKSATISKDGKDNYYIYVSSEGERANYPKYYREAEEKLVREQRKLSRMELRSTNWYKQKKKI